MLTVRSAIPEDEAAVVALWSAAGLVVPYNDPGSDFRFAVAGASSVVLVGTHRSARIVAAAMVGHDGHRGWLYYVATDPACRGHGFGRAIVEAAEAWLGERGVAKLQLMVRETNPGAVAFYEHLGFEVTPRTLLAKWLRPPANEEGGT